MTRSGTTLLDLLLGQVQGFVSGGELQKVWERGVIDDVLCSCGTPFSRCEFWRQVGDGAFGGWDRIDAERLGYLRRELQRHRNIPLLVAPRRPRAFQRDVGEYTDALLRLYRGIELASRGDVIVDSSKDPPHVFLLREVPGFELRMIHLVRDPRGVVWSWQKHVVRPEVTNRTAYMPRMGAGKAALLWLDHNALCHALEWLGLPRLSVRYETLVRSPGDELARVIRFADKEPGELPFLQDGKALLNGHHMLSGNPMRVGAQTVSLQVDDQWRDRLDPATVRMVSTVTWPLRRAYGYRE
jgi:Sulfotransferase family